MNNYPYNYMNNTNYNSNSLYDPYNAFIRGNLFENLYDPYIKEEPYEIKPLNEQAELLTYINSLCFSLKDINLYLDVFPDDNNMIDLYNQYREEKEKLCKKYEEMYGPITLDSNSLDTYPWTWTYTSWPWEK